MAKSLGRQFLKWFFVCCTIAIIIVFLGGCITQWLSPNKYWILGFFSLAFPYVALLLLFLCLFWFVAKPKFGFVSLIILCLGLHHYKNILGVHKGADFNKEKTNETLRLITWNIQGFNGLSKNKEAKKLVKTDIENCINRYDADIVCLQEFNTTTIANDAANNIELFQQKFPYHFFSTDYEKKTKSYQSGSIIFSKLPIINFQKIKYPAGESLIYVDVIKNNDTIRIFTTHLQSFKFKKEDYDEMDNIQHKQANALASMNIFRKMKLAFKRRSIQANIIQKASTNCKYKQIICGDFNDVPNSYTYYTIKGNKQDAFLQKQFGLGRTFIAFTPTLRIDYILPDNNFLVKQFEMVDENLSDHIMLLCDVEVKQ